MHWFRTSLAVSAIVCLVGISAPATVHAESSGDSESSTMKDDETNDVPAEKEKLIRKLVEVSNMTRMGQQVMDRMFKMLKRQHPSIPQSYWKKVKNRLDAEGLVDKLVPIFDKYYTKSDLKKLIEFYKSPIGQKLVKVQPKITREAMTVGREWGRNVAQRVLEDIQERKSEQNNESSE